MFARVAIPVPLGQVFSYTLTAELASNVRRGSRVLCEFGRRKVLGVVLEVSDVAPADVAPEKLKPVLALVDGEPVLPLELLDFLLELARYYLAPVGEVMRLALPQVERGSARALVRDGDPGLRLKAIGRLLKRARLAEGGRDVEIRAAKQRAVLDLLRERGPLMVAELEQLLKGSRAAVKRLTELGVVVLDEVAAEPDPFFALPVAPDNAPQLNAEQAAAVEAIALELDAQGRKGFLLHGVTGSGKTEVYLRAVQKCLARGGGAIVLVPEIALTPQLVARFRARIGDEIAVLHSGLSDADRHGMWKRLRSGALRVAVGARSALFAPVQNLRLICVDEEHDHSFKQEEGVRYHGRDMALLRAHRAGAVCVLGSATPSLESEMLVRQNRLTRLRLPRRAHEAAALPAVEIVDIRRVGAGPSKNRLLSIPLHRALEAVLERGEQAILFLNRRGFAPSVVCENCGTISECPNCSVALTLHRSRGQRLFCHYCDYDSEPPRRCPKCYGERFAQEGAGTERIELDLAETFPSARVARLDRDTGAGAKSEALLDRMRARELDILVGTQMVTKGHDLPGVTLVGVLNADSALSMPDFRAAERTFHLLVQVAGRAGRATTPGTVIVQTRDPDAYAVRFAVRHDVDGFVERELDERKELGYPPFARLALVKVDALEEAAARAACERLARVARAAARPGTQVIGPAPAPLERLRNRYRFRFMVRALDRAAVREALLAVVRMPSDRRVRVAVDVDPMSML